MASVGLHADSPSAPGIINSDTVPPASFPNDTQCLLPLPPLAERYRQTLEVKMITVMVLVRLFVGAQIVMGLLRPPKPGDSDDLLLRFFSIGCSTTAAIFSSWVRYILPNLVTSHSQLLKSRDYNPIDLEPIRYSEIQVLVACGGSLHLYFLPKIAIIYISFSGMACLAQMAMNIGKMVLGA